MVVGIRNSSNENVEQKLVYCGKEEGKLIAIRNIIREVGVSWAFHIGFPTSHVDFCPE